MATRTVEQTIRSAFERARGRTAAVHFIAITPAGYSVYAVDSTVRGAEYRCTCAAELRPACWHRAAVASVRASREAFGMPADGPTTEQTVAAEALARRTRAGRALVAIAEVFAA